MMDKDARTKRSVEILFAVQEYGELVCAQDVAKLIGDADKFKKAYQERAEKYDEIAKLLVKFSKEA
jgi:hypothetical protein